MAEQIKRGGRRGLVTGVLAAGLLLLVPVVAVAYFGSDLLGMARGAGRVDARSFAPVSADKPLPGARKAAPAADTVDVQLKVWEFTDNRRS